MSQRSFQFFLQVKHYIENSFAVDGDNPPHTFQKQYFERYIEVCARDVKLLWTSFGLGALVGQERRSVVVFRGGGGLPLVPIVCQGGTTAASDSDITSRACHVWVCHCAV